MSKITSASFLVTEDCNLNCIYCFEKTKERCNLYMSEEVAKKSIDMLINNALKEKRPSIGVTLFGGEPTLNLKLLYFILEYGSERTKENNLNFDLDIITNATILTDEHIEFYKEWYKTLGYLSVQLSIDGIPEVQDHNRPFKNGNKTSKIVETNIKKYVELFKELNQPLERLCIHSVLSKYSLKHAYESYKYFLSLGAKCIWFMPCHEEPWDEQDFIDFREQYQSIADYIYNKCIENNNLDYFQCFSSIGKCNTSMNNKPCSAGVNYCSITAKGDMYVCHHFYFNDDKKQFKFGNVLLEEPDDIEKRKFFLEYQGGEMQGKTKCKDCDIQHCYRCIAANYVNNGDCLEAFPNYCELSLIEDDIKRNLKAKLREYGFVFDEDKTTFDVNQKINLLIDQVQKLTELNLNQQKQNDLLIEQIEVLSDSLSKNNKLIISLAKFLLEKEQQNT